MATMDDGSLFTACRSPEYDLLSAADVFRAVDLPILRDSAAHRRRYSSERSGACGRNHVGSGITGFSDPGGFYRVPNAGPAKSHAIATNPLAIQQLNLKPGNSSSRLSQIALSWSESASLTV